MSNATENDNDEVKQPWANRILKQLAQLEADHPNHSVEHEEFVMGPLSIGLFAASCLGILGIGFRIGAQQADKLENSESFNVRLLGQKVDCSPKVAQMIKTGRPPQLQGQPSAPPAVLAMRALGYATVLTISTASLIGVLGTWYFQITSVNDLIWRLKRNVPEHSKAIQRTVGPGLESTKSFFSNIFSGLRPYIGDPYQSSEEAKAQERKVLQDVGIDPSILDPSSK